MSTKLTLPIATLLILVGSSTAAESVETTRNAPTEQAQRNSTEEARSHQSADAPLRLTTIDEDEQSASSRARDEAAQKDREENREAQRLASRLGVAQAGFALAGMFLLFLTLVYTARSANAAKKSADAAAAALSHTVIAADAAAKSSGTAEKALLLSSEQFALTRRPYIAIEPAWGLATNCSFGPPDNPGRPADYFVCQGMYKNIGQTPATGVRLLIELQVIPKSDEPTWKVKSPVDGPKAILFPEQTGKSDPVFISGADYTKVLNGKSKAIVKFEVKYTSPETMTQHGTLSFYQLTFATTFSEYVAGNYTGVMAGALAGADMT